MPSPSSIKYFQRKAFTLVELICVVAIAAVLATVLVTFVVGTVSYAQQTRDKQTLAVLNNALTRYKCEGGDVNALTASVPIASVIAKLQADTTWAGLTHSFLQKGKTYPARSIYAKGEKAQYRFTAFNTYMAETGGTSPTSLTNGLVGWWKLDQANGATDLSGNGNNGSAQNGLTFGTAASHKGQANGATIFDGVDDLVLVGSPALLDNLPQFTVSLWANAQGYGGGSQGYLVSKCNYGANGWRGNVYVTGSTIRFVMDYAGASDLIVDGIANTFPSSNFNQWILWTFVYNGLPNRTDVSVYKNGILVAQSGGTDGAGTRVSDAAQNVVIGNNSTVSPDRGFYGALDDVRIYNRALSAEEVLQLYNQ